MRLSYFLSLVTILFTAGTMLLQFLTILAGTKEDGVLRQWYWLKVDTSSIEGAAPITEYNLWGYCTRDGDSIDEPGQSTGCTSNEAAYGFEPDVEFDEGVPQWFSDNHTSNYFLSRLLFPWFLIALVFTTPVLFMSACAPARRRFGVASSLLTLVAFLFQASGSAMAVVVYVRSRNRFQDAGIDAKLGSALQGFIWASTFMLLVNIFFFCCIRPYNTKSDDDNNKADYSSNNKGRDNNNNHHHHHNHVDYPPTGASDNHTATEAALEDTSGGRFFGFRNSTNKQKSNGDDSSFVRAH